MYTARPCFSTPPSCPRAPYCAFTNARALVEARLQDSLTHDAFEKVGTFKVVRNITLTKTSCNTIMIPSTARPRSSHFHHAPEPLTVP